MNQTVENQALEHFH